MSWDYGASGKYEVRQLVCERPLSQLYKLLNSKWCQCATIMWCQILVKFKVTWTRANKIAGSETLKQLKLICMIHCYCYGIFRLVSQCCCDPAQLRQAVKLVLMFNRFCVCWSSPCGMLSRPWQASDSMMWFAHRARNCLYNLRRWFLSSVSPPT